MVEGVDGGERGASALNPALVAAESVAGSAGSKGAAPVVVVACRFVLGEGLTEGSAGSQGDQGAQPSDRIVLHQRGNARSSASWASQAAGSWSLVRGVDMVFLGELGLGGVQQVAQDDQAIWREGAKAAHPASSGRTPGSVIRCSAARRR